MSNINNDSCFLLFANCIPVKGAKRSIICDLQLNRYRFIPNILYEIISNNRNKTVTQIKDIYKGQYNDGIDLFFNLFVKENWGFYTDSPKQFPLLDLTWNSPLKITNSIIDIDAKSDYNFLEVIQQLSEVNCEALQVRIFNEISIDFLKKISNQLIDTSVLYVDLIIKHTTLISRKNILDLVYSNPRIRQVIICNSPFKKIIHKKETNFGLVIYIKENVTNSSHCGVVNEKYFNSNIQLFTESQKYNSCLNKKISVDVNGNIKNCPSMSLSFGNIKDKSILDAFNSKGFDKYWNINKDQIDVCKDCEFRYICTDCRAYTENKSPFSKPKKCSYNPYEASWN